MSELSPWKRLVGEEPEAYEAFIEYLHDPQMESSDRYSPEQVRQWALQYAWSERSSRYRAQINRELHELQISKHSSEIGQFLEQQRKLSSKMQNLVNDLIEKAEETLNETQEELSIGQALAMFKLALELSKYSQETDSRILGVSRILKLKTRDRKGHV